MKTAALRKRLLAWYDANKRDLPWRRTRDPYAIWISESMLQQTRVETVIPYYERFLARFPDVQALADADEEAVLGAWAGLGYYSRARNLQRAAQILRDRHAGRLPQEAQELRELPGIGRYTAGAVASIAFDRPEPVVDGNVIRVLTRLHRIEGDPRSAGVAQRLWQAAAELARGERPGDLNQALMELGATHCAPNAPRCPACPWTRACVAQRDGVADRLPTRAARKAPLRVEAAGIALRRSGRILLVKRPAGGLLGGLWELPAVELRPAEKPARALRRLLAGRLGLRIGRLVHAARIEHVFSHRRLALELYRGEQPAGRLRPAGFEDCRWFGARELARLPRSALLSKALEATRARAGPIRKKRHADETTPDERNRSQVAGRGAAGSQTPRGQRRGASSGRRAKTQGAPGRRR